MTERKGNPVLWEKYGETMDILMEGFHLPEAFQKEVALMSTTRLGDEQGIRVVVNERDLEKLSEDGQALVLSYALARAVSREIGIGDELKSVLMPFLRDAQDPMGFASMLLRQFARIEKFGEDRIMDFGRSISIMQTYGYSIPEALRDYHANVSPVDLEVVGIIKDVLAENTEDTENVRDLEKFSYELLSEKLKEKYEAVPLETYPEFEKFSRVIDAYCPGGARFYVVSKDKVPRMQQEGIPNHKNYSVFALEFYRKNGLSDGEIALALTARLFETMNKAWWTENPKKMAKEDVVTVLYDSSYSVADIVQKNFERGDMPPEEAMDWTGVALMKDMGGLDEYKKLCTFAQSLKKYLPQKKGEQPLTPKSSKNRGKN